MSAEPDGEGSLVLASEADGSEPDCWWSPAWTESEAVEDAHLVKRYRAGKLSDIKTYLSAFNPDIEAVETAGQNAFVRLRGNPIPLPIGVLGDGAPRILELALALTSDNSLVCLDEVENGFHVSSLPAVLRMLQSARPDKPIFASTHRDELIRVACEVFLSAGDDGLRIIRLDKRGDLHYAAVYTAAEALAAMESGLEIRG